jgi:hypothetical protein
LKASREVEVVVERLVDGHMEAEVKIKRRVKDLVQAKTKREITHITLMIRIIETKEEEEDLGEDQEEEASTEPIFQCGEEGNRAYECPQHQGRTNIRPKGNTQVAYVDEDAYSSHYEDVERGEAFVVKSALLNDEKEPDQRNNLFYTRCKCEGKVCNVIIYGGSTDNLV